jgi:ketosteroid isomerase-like protein
MSQENVEVVRRQFEAWSAGDLDRSLMDWDPDVIVVPPQGWPEGEVIRGLDAWRRQGERLRDSWAEARIEIDEIRAVDDRVLVRIRYVTRGADTGLPFETPMTAVFFFGGGKIKRAEYYWERADALEAAGLSE